MASPQTQKQLETYRMVCHLVAKRGRGVTLREIAEALGKSISTVHVHVRALKKDGHLDRDGAGVQPTGDGGRYRHGWAAAVDYLKESLSAVLIQHHADRPMIQAVRQALDDAKAGGGA